MDTKFYIDTQGNDDKAYQSAMRYACDELSKKDAEIKKIVLYIHTKKNTGWFDRLYGSDVVKKLFNGSLLKGFSCTVPFKFETKLTYKKYQYQYSSGTDVVICCGINADDILKIDDYHSVKYIIAIPWLKTSVEKWIRTWNAKKISGKENDEKYPEPSPIVQLAMRELTTEINMTTGIVHPHDNHMAKTFIKSLHKYEPELNADSVRAFLVRELHWDTRHAKDVEKLIETLNDGRYFKGGQKTGLQNYYKRWKKECESMYNT